MSAQNQHFPQPSYGHRHPPALTPNKQPVTTNTSSSTTTYAQFQLGVSISQQKKRAIEECKATVERIAARCRRKNRKFRDIEFDLENDRSRCLHDLASHYTFLPQEIRRITELVEKPVFYSGGLRAAEVVVGDLMSDDHFISALSSITSMPNLVEELCVARDEEIGVYGFVFYRDCYWVPVVVDDSICTRTPRYEQLNDNEKELYHRGKQAYDKTARNSMDALYFAKAGHSQDTWVPLVEKAFAKLSGDYASIMTGRVSESLEDITGGVSNSILTIDILDRDKFWREELLNANEDRMFSCVFMPTANPRGGLNTVEGLVGNTGHTIIKAVECNGKQFVILRDPYGESQWTGRWSDGSKQWTPEWLEKLSEIGYSFAGPTGQFMMEYSDFMDVWQEIERTLVCDDSWVMSSQWLHLPEQKETVPWNYGDVIFTFSLPAATRTIIALTKVNQRYYRDINGAYVWNIDFVLVKEGETVPIAESSYSYFYARSVTVELELEPGNYVVLARLDPKVSYRSIDYYKLGVEGIWDKAKLRQNMIERERSWSIASNYKPKEKYLVKTVSDVLQGNVIDTEKSALGHLRTHANEGQDGAEGVTITTNTTTQTVVSRGAATTQNHMPGSHAHDGHHVGYGGYPQGPDQGFRQGHASQHYYPSGPPADGAYPTTRSPVPAPYLQRAYTPVPMPPAREPSPPPVAPLAQQPPGQDSAKLEDDNAIVVGLKVYTKGVTPTTITARLNVPAPQ